MFCVVALEHSFKCSFKVGNDEFEELSNRDGFVPAPYLARAKWVLVENRNKLHQPEWQRYIHQCYELVKQIL